MVISLPYHRYVMNMYSFRSFVKLLIVLLSHLIYLKNEIIDALSTLNSNKACGPDLISRKMLKYVANSVSTEWKCGKCGNVENNSVLFDVIKNILKTQAVSMLNLFYMLTLSCFFFVLFQINERLVLGCGHSEGPGWNRCKRAFGTLFIYLSIYSVKRILW